MPSFDSAGDTLAELSAHGVSIFTQHRKVHGVAELLEMLFTKKV